MGNDTALEVAKTVKSRLLICRSHARTMTSRRDGNTAVRLSISKR